MSELNATNLRKEHVNEGPDLVGLTELTSPYFMVPPSGSTAERPQNPEKGTLRFNTDSGSLEYFKGDGMGWESINRTTPNLNGGARGVFMGGHNEPDPSSAYDIIDYITIPTLGNAIDFGNLLATEMEGNAFSSSTRGFHFGGDPADNEIETIVFSSTGNSTDYGDLTATSKTGIGLADATRGIAYLNNGNTINYVTMAATGTAVDFGNASFSGGANGMGCASSTRGVLGAAYVSPSAVNTLDYLTIQTTGNTADFGDLTTLRYAGSGASNSVRGVFMNGYVAPTVSNTIDYITIASTGNAIDFGDCVTALYLTAGCASSTRMVSGGGMVAPSITNAIEYVEIMTTGNAVDFGDLTQKRRHLDSCSNAHGGL